MRGPPSMTPRAHTFRQRLAALFLAVLFVVQSAAQASAGCLSSALTGRCSCAAMSTATLSTAGDSSPEHAAVRSCCAREESSPPAPAGPAITRESSCHCQLAPTPPSSAIAPTSIANDPDAQARAAFAHWIEEARASTLHFAEVAARPPPNPLWTASPPRHAHCAIAFQRLAQRGVVGFLSDICTARL